MNCATCGNLIPDHFQKLGRKYCRRECAPLGHMSNYDPNNKRKAGANIKHGTLYAYNTARCRCEPCKDFMKLYRRAYKRSLEREVNERRNQRES